MGKNPELAPLGMILIISLSFVLAGTSIEGNLAVHATPTLVNAIANSGFESSMNWTAYYSTSQGSYASIQDSTYHEEGSCSGLTRTTSPKQESCSAILEQSLNIPVQSYNTLNYWIRKGNSASYGYYWGGIELTLSNGWSLLYYHGFDSSSPPNDSSNFKYIDMGNPATGTWVQFSRNLFNDLTLKFGQTASMLTISNIYLLSTGYKDLETGEAFGQTVNWDTLSLSADLNNYTISLTSHGPNEQTNIGNITFNNVIYMLPNNLTVFAGNYSITSNVTLYLFNWEASSLVSVGNSTSQSTTVSITGNGTLDAIFSKRAWTFMVYMAADNDRDVPRPEFGIPEGFANFSFNALERAGSSQNGNLSVVVQFDGFASSDTRRYYVIHDDSNSTVSPVVQDLGELNMGSKSTLSDFIQWGITNYPAEKYALILWDHGDGFLGTCWDQQDGTYDDMKKCPRLHMSDLESAITTAENNTGVTLDLIGFDACLMSEIEVGYQLNGLAKVFVASEEEEWGTQWPYAWILGNLTNNLSMTSQELGTQIVTSYGDYYANSSQINYATMYASNMTNMANLADSVSGLGQWLKDNLNVSKSQIDYAYGSAYKMQNGWYTMYMDLYNFSKLLYDTINDSSLDSLCLDVMQNVNNTLLASWRGPASESSGFSLFFPNNDSYTGYRSEYDKTRMSVDYQWDEFLNAYFNV